MKAKVGTGEDQPPDRGQKHPHLPFHLENEISWDGLASPLYSPPSCCPPGTKNTNSLWSSEMPQGMYLPSVGTADRAIPSPCSLYTQPFLHPPGTLTMSGKKASA